MEDGLGEQSQLTVFNLGPIWPMAVHTLNNSNHYYKEYNLGRYMHT